MFTARLVPPRGIIARSQSRSEDETISLPSSFTPRAHGSTCAAAWHYSEIARSQSRSGDEPISLPSSSIPPSQHDRPKGKTARSAGRHTADTSSEFAEHACEPPPARRQVLRPACRSVGEEGVPMAGAVRRTIDACKCLKHKNASRCRPNAPCV